MLATVSIFFINSDFAYIFWLLNTTQLPFFVVIKIFLFIFSFYSCVHVC